MQEKGLSHATLTLPFTDVATLNTYSELLSSSSTKGSEDQIWQDIKEILDSLTLLKI